MRYSGLKLTKVDYNPCPYVLLGLSVGGCGAAGVGDVVDVAG